MTPTDLEDRLRRDLAAEAARTRASMLRPLAEPRGAPRRTLAGWRAPRGARRWLAPAAAMVAVAGVVAGVTLAGSGLRARPGAGATAGAAQGFPRFYASVKPGPHARVLIHSSRTGRVVSSEPLSGVAGIGSDALIAASANDRVFAIAATVHLAITRHPYVGLFTLEISRNGRVRVLIFDGQPGLATQDDTVNGIALSPDGRKLAVALQVPGQPGHVQGEIKVFEDTALTGTWRASAGAGGYSAAPADPAWLAGGQSLGFLWWDKTPGWHEWFSPRRERLLDTAAPGRDLLASSKVIAAAPRGTEMSSALLSAGGRTLLGTWFRNIPGTFDRGVAVTSFGRVGLRGGRSVVIQHRAIRYRSPNQEGRADLSCRVLSVAGRDSAALVYCGGILERYQDGYAVSLPTLGANPIVAW